MTLLEQTIWDWTHGWHGFVLVYGLVALFSLAGLRHGGATIGQYVLWPVTALPTMFVVLTVGWLLFGLIEMAAHVQWSWMAQEGFMVLVAMAGSVLGGIYWARGGRSRAAVATRGAVVIDGAAAQRAALKVRKQALKAPNAQFPLTLGGVTVPFVGSPQFSDF